MPSFPDPLLFLAFFYFRKFFGDTRPRDGSIWFNIAGQNKYERAYLSNLDEAFELAKSKCDIEVANPDKVYVMFNRDNHMDICAEVIRQLQKSYSDENIVFAQEPWVVTVPPPPGLTIDTEKDDYLIVLINANNEIRLEGKWTPAEGVKASFNSNGTISPQEIYMSKRKAIKR